ncbi:MAG: hypothetical protein ED559_06150 [Phycisphaera sp.]|nr:MAG: hypothetical protein ED559_06150 [Phycisphaera sp.]
MSGTTTPHTTRDLVLAAFDRPRCARDLAERTGLKYATVKSCLRRMRRRRYIKPLTIAPQARLYALTPIGRILRESLASRVQLDRPISHPEHIAWIESGSYRRAVFRVMTEPMTPREIRRRAVEYHPRLGSGHVHATLRAFSGRGIASRDTRGAWGLTQLGATVHVQMFNGGHLFTPPARSSRSPSGS